ncbi:hypothetical protein CXF72_16985 [Psychromonas sp. MB-3u-54]|uniref:DUF6279 family lipoprotein n=1 Tax=Psychromonas sp. MB-3u-54 TaxID=2058319 RepID=UPI000C3375F6|nr:DUF6279 family lipoprotein [Psychromonas sp. MB-3u-54]PKH01367.1 hypothetical protein CXF72_16985 [Psychromonas sp. MB-3u-54]
MIKNKKYRGLLLIFLLLGVSACSSKLIYNNLDWLSYWYIDDYITLTNEQETEFDPALVQFLDWHRQSEIPRYITQMKLLKKELNNGLEQDDIDDYIKTFTGFWQAILIGIEPGVVKLATSLKEEQITEFLAATEKKNRDRIEDYEDLSNQARLDKRFDKIESRLASFIGKLNASQQQLIKSTNEQQLSTFVDWIEFRRDWANSIREAYTLRGDKPAFEKALSRSILQADSFRSAQFKQKIAYNQKLWKVTLTQLIDSLNKKQLRKLNDKLDDITEDLEALL